MSHQTPASPHFPEPHALSRPQKVYLWLAAINVTALLLANIVGVKLFHIDVRLFGYTIPVEHTIGMLPFPITFLLTDLLNEYFGKRATRRVMYVSFSMAALAWLLIALSREFPTMEGIPGTATHAAYENVFGAAALMYLASIIAFFVGSLIDIAVFGAFKRLTNGKMVWLRATGSTIVSQVFDSLVITFVFFQVLQRVSGNDAPTLEWTLKTAATGYILKFVIAVVMTPVIYAGRWVLRRWFGLVPMPAE